MLVEIKEAAGKDQDPTVDVVGSLHSSRGFKVRISDLDYFEESVAKRWSNICRAHGYAATITVMMTQGYATIVCRKLSVVDKYLDKTLAAVAVVAVMRLLYLAQCIM